MTRSFLATLDPETARTIVSHPHRRHLLVELEHGDPTTVSELARDIADRDPEPSSEDADRSGSERVELELVHDHLPRLDAHDVLEYRRESNEVVLTAPLEDDPSEALLEPLLESW